MNIKVKSTRPAKMDCQALFVWVTDDWQKELADIDQDLSGLVLPHLKKLQFEAKEGKVVEFTTHGKIAASTLVIFGLGKLANLTADSIRNLAAKTIRHAQAYHYTQLAIDCTRNWQGKLPADVLAQAVTEGVILGSYHFGKYKARVDAQVEKIFLLCLPARIGHYANGVTKGQIMATATNFARDLVNEAPSVTTPSYLADVAQSLSQRGKIRVEIMEERQINALGMGAFLSVAKGSSEPAKFIKLHYLNKNKPKIVLIGKAITFDTGGLSLKSAPAMESMKLDMAGAAAVLGIFKVIAEIAPKAEVIGLIGACENMPGPNASKPGDIIRVMNGKTIEILNTDAEGRLTLADLLSYADLKVKPDMMIDLATLTGACVAALGEEMAGLFSNDPALAEALKKSSSKTGEKLWQLPLEKNYQELIKSHIADLRNITKNRYGGAITAALFLQEFVGEVKWAHIDIAGPAFYEKDTPLISKGASGFGVRLILEYLKNF